MINQSEDHSLKEGLNSMTKEPCLALASNILDSEVSVHMQAKVLKFMKQQKGTIQGAYTINDDKVVLKRVVMLSYPNEITIIHTQEVIDGQLHESYLPETIRDLNLIENNGNNDQTNQTPG